MSTLSKNDSSQSPETLPLPKVISDYFAAANDGRIDDAADCFAENALVHDESHDHAGRLAIREWIAEATGKYQPKTEILRVEERESAIAVTSRVSGTFPGSPVELEFLFTTADDGISHLTIG